MIPRVRVGRGRGALVGELWAFPAETQDLMVPAAVPINSHPLEALLVGHQIGPLDILAQWSWEN